MLSREERERAMNFLFTDDRGEKIMSKALFIAIKVLERAPIHSRHEDEIADMRYLHDTLFTTFGRGWISAYLGEHEDDNNIQEQLNEILDQMED